MLSDLSHRTKTEEAAPTVPTATTSPACARCLARSISLCAGISDQERSVTTFSDKQFQRIPARRMIFQSREYLDFVAVICGGWASSAVQASGDVRQIVSVLLPGDVATMQSLHAPMHGREIEAVTEVAYRRFSVAAFREAIDSDPKFAMAVIREILGTVESGSQLALDLGRRTAAQRVARLILQLKKRLKALRMSDGRIVQFPLRQRHIADATGLTQVHVCKVLKRLTQDGMIRLEHQSLTVFDKERLQAVALGHIA
jgi:CRP-like cAMP-binding protein